MQGFCSCLKKRRNDCAVNYERKLAKFICLEIEMLYPGILILFILFFSSFSDMIGYDDKENMIVKRMNFIFLFINLAIHLY